MYVDEPPPLHIPYVSPEQTKQHRHQWTQEPAISNGQVFILFVSTLYRYIIYEYGFNKYIMSLSFESLNQKSNKSE